MTITTTDFHADTILFDLDGTLTDSAPGILGGFRHALATVGAPEPSDEVLSRVVGPPMVDMFHELGLDDDRTEVALSAYFERYDASGWAENAVFDGVTEMLDSLAGSGATLAVATSKRERLAHRILDHFGLSHHFAFIAGASEDGTRRAKSDVIARALTETGHVPTTAADGGTPSVLMIGDRVHDVHGAAHWGIPAVIVEWGYGLPDESAGARWSVASPADLRTVLDAVTR